MPHQMILNPQDPIPKYLFHLPTNSTPYNLLNSLLHSFYPPPRAVAVNPIYHTPPPGSQPQFTHRSSPNPSQNSAQHYHRSRRNSSPGRYPQQQQQQYLQQQQQQVNGYLNVPHRAPRSYSAPRSQSKRDSSPYANSGTSQYQYGSPYPQQQQQPQGGSSYAGAPSSGKTQYPHGSPYPQQQIHLQVPSHHLQKAHSAPQHHGDSSSSPYSSGTGSGTGAGGGAATRVGKAQSLHVHYATSPPHIIKDKPGRRKRRHSHSQSNGHSNIYAHDYAQNPAPYLDPNVPQPRSHSHSEHNPATSYPYLDPNVHQPRSHSHSRSRSHSQTQLPAQPQLQSKPRAPKSQFQIPLTGIAGVDKYLRALPPAQDFCWSKCTGRKKAVCIGINYYGQKDELKGCINDARHMRDYLVRYHNFQKSNILLLTDDRGSIMPTRKNMLEAMRWLVKDARQHDSLFFHYSGHGGQQRDNTGMEADGLDEVIFPVDYNQTKSIIDDELHKELVEPLPAGCRLTALFDSCHSGTVLDLPYLHSAHGRLRGLEHISKRTRSRGAPHADVISFAACKDDETSADTFHGGVAVGAMSYAFMKTLKDNPRQTYDDLLAHLRGILRPKYDQKPQLGCTYPLDLKRDFII